VNRRGTTIGRVLVPALFAAAAIFTSARSVGEIRHALDAETTRAWLLAGYGILRAGVAVAFALFTVGRSEPRRRAREPLAFAVCAAAMATVLLFSEPSSATPNSLVIAGEAVSVLAYVWLFASVLALGRCFGVLPEARGLVTRGPYRLVRHPVYLGEIVACAGLALASPMLVNAAALTALFIAQLTRMRLEERALTQAFPRYTAYAASTPRLLPRLRRVRVSLAHASADPVVRRWERSLEL